MAAKISSMYKKSGGCNRFHNCGECDYLMVIKNNNRKRCKCLLYGDDGTSATDWSERHMACKKFKERVVEPKEKPREQIEGQMSIFDFIKD